MAIFVEIYTVGFTACALMVFRENINSGGYGMFGKPNVHPNNEFIVRPLVCMGSAMCDSLVWPVRLPVAIINEYDQYVAQNKQHK